MRCSPVLPEQVGRDGAPASGQAATPSSAARPGERGAAQPHVLLVDCTVHAPSQARAAVAACAPSLGADEAVDDLLLVVSELVTNAVRHGAPPVRIELSADEERVLVCVADGSPRPPQPRTADETAEGGRGMTLVGLLSSASGVRPRPPGKTVWASLPKRPGPLAAD